MKRRTGKPRSGDKRGKSSPQAHKRPQRFTREISVLYEDDSLIVINKPPGLLSVPIKGAKTPSAASMLDESLKLKRQRALVVHRIDRFVSGILVFAKSHRDREVLVQQFLDHTPLREYLAVVRGRLQSQSGTLVHYFRRQGMHQVLRNSRDPQAARAELHYAVEETFANAALVRVELVTGLQNQIRAQFAALGHPVIGDRKYAPEESSEPLIARVALHAAYVEFVHPRTGESISIDCKPPADFQHLVEKLSKPRRTKG